ncbi:WhiB family transcriptional regulator [Nocardiopsis changdeensis]|uniref:Transcriptional regulator WhiB n=1 Tax=Nocardiopsis changdeensis TaxID=2831969 RepID=A0ABX8BDN7_9ACTN|nr:MULTISPECIES: WhiB family transcriptional regulator [Nocardiopsis]QUX20355.1 WhiB family transcriptional regulator [Nocardiopsis changdeensis]QYX36285.1 WhiB family transcriptional regulator [Nocardiopsis sp. MT53]
MRYVRAANTRDQRSAPTVTDWRDQAACRDHDADLFFDDTKAGIAAAKAICAACSMRTDCLEYAITKPERYGVFGGMDADQRHAERRNRWRRANAAAQRGEADTVTETVVDATGTRRRLQALAVIGVGVRTVERHITTAAHDYLDRIRTGKRERVPADLAKEVADIYPSLVATGGVAAGGAAMAAARKRNWPGPRAWEGLDIDDPRVGPMGEPQEPREEPKRKPRVPSEGCARRLQAAATAGIPLSVVTEATGLSVSFLSKVRAGKAVTLHAQTAELIRRVWPQVAASEVFSPGTIGQAVTNGWLPLEAWEGVDIDDPDAQPRQTAAA